MRDIIILCFDYGEKHIGIAAGQALTATATPLEVVRVWNGRPDWRRIGEIIDAWRPQALVVGRPLQMDGARQALTGAAERFGRRLHGRFQLPVHHADERLTSYEARQRGAGRAEVDAVAAQVILETWLAEQAQNPDPDVTIADP